MHWTRTDNLRKAAVILIGLQFAAHLPAATIPQNTLAAWDAEVESAKAELKKQPHIRYSGSSVSPAVMGEVRVVPSGLIHHWTGVVFLPDVHVLDVLSVLEDYDRYAEFYSPAVVESKLENRHANEFAYQLKFVQKDFGIKSGLLGTFRTTYYRMSGEAAGYSITEATQLVELRNPGTLDEQPIAETEARGYVERTLTIVRYGQCDRGVSLEVENLTLSRGVPAPVRWIAMPIIERVSRKTLITTLQLLVDHIQNSEAFASASRR